MFVVIADTMTPRFTMHVASLRQTACKRKIVQIFAIFLKSEKIPAAFQSVIDCERPLKHYSGKSEVGHG
jgi:hypothetical protein